MNDLRRFLSFLCIPLLFLVGMKRMLLAHLGHIGLPSLEAWLKVQIAQVPSSWGHAWWALILLLPVVLFVLWLHQHYSGKTLSLDTQSGHSLVIRQKAVERYIRECLMARPFVKDVRIKTKDTRGTLSVKLRVFISATSQVHLLQQQLVEQVIEDAKRGFGITDMPKPDIIVEAVQSPKSGDVRTGCPEGTAAVLADSPTERQMAAAEEEAVDAEEILDTEVDAVNLPEPEEVVKEPVVQEEHAKPKDEDEAAGRSQNYTFATLGDKAFDTVPQEDGESVEEKQEESKESKEPGV